MQPRKQSKIRQDNLQKERGLELVEWVELEVGLELELELEREQASWYQQRWQPTVSLGNQTSGLLLVHEALQTPNQCYQQSHTWCHNEGKHDPIGQFFCAPV